MSYRLLALFFALSLAVSGCGAVSELASLLPPDGGGQATPAPVIVRTAAPTDPPLPAYFNVCELVPLAEVQARSPLRSPLVLAEPDSFGVEDTCRYNSSIEPPVDWPNSFVLTLRDLGTAENALLVLEDFRVFELERDRPVGDVAGIGDKAYSTTEHAYNAIVEAVMGRYWAHIVVSDSGNLEFPEVPIPQKVAAGADIIRFAFTQIP